jgi:hypothetical protein
MADDDTEEMKETVVREGVSIPVWVAGALLVVLALAIGGVGYAIGNSDSNNDILDPVASIREAPDEIAREIPGGRGGPGDFRRPGGPGGEHRGGECERGEGERGEGEDGDESGDQEDGDSGENENDPLDPFVPDDEGAQF